MITQTIKAMGGVEIIQAEGLRQKKKNQSIEDIEE